MYAVETYRNGRYLCGNAFHAAGVRRDLKTDRGAINWAKRLIAANSKPGDIVHIVASDGNSYDFNRSVATITFYGRNGKSPVITVR